MPNITTNHAIICLYYYTRKRFVIFTCRYFKLSWNTTALSQSNCSNFSCSSIMYLIGTYMYRVPRRHQRGAVSILIPVLWNYFLKNNACKRNHIKLRLGKYFNILKFCYRIILDFLAFWCFSLNVAVKTSNNWFKKCEGNFFSKNSSWPSFSRSSDMI